MFFVDPDIRMARTLPSVFYTDPTVFELAREKIFARSWQLICGPEAREQLTPFNLLPGVLDEPLLMVRSGDGGLRCLSNVCTHRGKVLVERPCTADLIRCGYHGRRFSLEGKFLSMPEFDGVEGFPSADDDLKPVPSAGLGDFMFASVDPAASFERFCEGIGDHVDDGEWRGLKLLESRDYEVEAHWAIYCENYLEGFHIPYVHKSLNQIVDYGTYTTDTLRYASVQTGFDSAGSVVGRYVFIFPNMMFNFYPWGISVNVVMPTGPACTVVRYFTYVRDAARMKEGAGADLDRVEVEDEMVVASVQKGIRSRFYSHGRYSPSREQGTHHFHRLIAEFMA